MFKGNRQYNHYHNQVHILHHQYILRNYMCSFRNLQFYDMSHVQNHLNLMCNPIHMVFRNLLIECYCKLFLPCYFIYVNLRDFLNTTSSTTGFITGSTFAIIATTYPTVACCVAITTRTTSITIRV